MFVALAVSGSIPSVLAEMVIITYMILLTKQFCASGDTIPDGEGQLCPSLGLSMLGT